MAYRCIASSLFLSLMLGGCQSRGSVVAVPNIQVAGPEQGWRRIALPDDQERIDRLEAAWNEALAEANAAGFSRQVRAEGRLLDPSTALPRPAPAPGSYMCRLIRLGTAAGRGRAFQAFRPFFCHVGVEGDILSITKQTGSERPGGYLWEDAGTSRLIFLGTLALGNEQGPRGYGEDRSRDMIGVFERVGPLRYRLAVPWPRGDSKLDLFELVPAPTQPDD